MIGKVTRGWNVYGLIYYLMGKGNEQSPHTDQHVIASWDGCPDLHQPAQLGPDQFDIGDMVRDLRAPAQLAGLPNNRPKEFPEVGCTRIPKGPVWQCSLRNHPGDPILSDEQWTEVVLDVLDRTGIAPAGDLGACRWVAIRHAEDHVHIAAVLVRQDTGELVHPHRNFDFRRVKEACTAAEQRLGLKSTGGADRTATPRPTRAESEKAARLETLPARDRLREKVQVAAFVATGWDTFRASLAGRSLAVRVHRGRDGRIDGYAVTDPRDPACMTAGGDPIYFGGSKLAPDLSLPSLCTRWAAGGGIVTASDPTRALASAADVLRRSTANPESVFFREAAEGVAYMASDALFAVYWATGGPDRQPAREAWQAYGRAARVPYQVMPSRWGPHALRLRGLSRQLVIAASKAPDSRVNAVAVVALVTVVISLLVEVAAWHETQNNLAAASHARTAGVALAKIAEVQSSAGGPRRPLIAERQAFRATTQQPPRRERQR
ncbi:relaxase/mobilization nuclease domain-containing protein [Kutzneria sp. CA-103260]|uniref:relaxase/mobilization nuclease domain-containing protein n=1 Tax=Kutzneria sp. CA-103260 TaxID=2802641 RepID=UPI001BA5F3CA|nr:hypothetical protein [Kutzneria sp. CA-103260]QUQ72536.1 hypothetical protein JJ691_103250 [Kutzneria sp. CA-103260]